MTEKLKNKIKDEQLKIRAISDEKITVKLTNNYAFQKIFKNAEKWAMQKKLSLYSTVRVLAGMILKFPQE